ncbi:MAG: hypothetical protein H6981_08435 [Gammaproteobacteria bacterium]|nr:hypothetical protein [Gammaproteobacteria bacterium]MCP5136814.1 hypothetical protein [Gammaproteobacteria bacterium]
MIELSRRDLLHCAGALALCPTVVVAKGDRVSAMSKRNPEGSSRAFHREVDGQDLCLVNGWVVQVDDLARARQE